MTIEVLKCPYCGAPLPPNAVRGVTICGYCNRTLVANAGGGFTGARLDLDLSREPLGGPWQGDGAPRVTVNAHRFVVLGRIARGDGCDVFFARTDSRLAELVVLKALRADADEAHLARGWRAVERLCDSDAQGAEFFGRLLPQPVTFGPIKEHGGRACAVYRWRSGFVHTFEDVFRAHPEGVDGQTAVWMWKRALEFLGWVHRSGWVHGGVIPPNLLVHARDHGVALVGWSAATRNAGEGTREALPVTSAAHEAYYPAGLWRGRPATVADDLTMTARCVLRALGGDPSRGTLPASLPAPLRAQIERYIDPDAGAARTDDAWALKEAVGTAGKAAYGPPRYHPFAMPGWR